MFAPTKRGLSPDGQNDSRRPKTQETIKRSSRKYKHTSQGLEPGQAGIWATCNMGKESKCVGELRDLFQEYAEKVYGQDVIASADVLAAADKLPGNENSDEEEDEGDIEASIKAEVQGIQKPISKPLFVNIRIDVQCVLFLRTRSPINPVELVHKICSDAAHAMREGSSGSRRTRFVKRLTPVTRTAQANESSLIELATVILEPHFHTDIAKQEGRTFAIRPTIRAHGSQRLSRQSVIELIARSVGPGHKVNLNEPDLVILVEVYKNVVGMSVVPGGFERLKRYNLMEIQQPGTDVVSA